MTFSHEKNSSSAQLIEVFIYHSIYMHLLLGESNTNVLINSEFRLLRYPDTKKSSSM